MALTRRACRLPQCGRGCRPRISRFGADPGAWAKTKHASALAYPARTFCTAANIVTVCYAVGGCCKFRRLLNPLGYDRADRSIARPKGDPLRLSIGTHWIIAPRDCQSFSQRASGNRNGPSTCVDSAGRGRAGESYLRLKENESGKRGRSLRPRPSRSPASEAQGEANQCEAQ